MFDQQATNVLIAHRRHTLEQGARQDALLAEVRAGAVRQPRRWRLAAWAGERLLRLRAPLGVAAAATPPGHTERGWHGTPPP